MNAFPRASRNNDTTFKLPQAEARCEWRVSARWQRNGGSLNPGAKTWYPREILQNARNA